MGVEPAEGEPVDIGEIQLSQMLSRLRDEEPELVRKMAGRWVEGLKILVGFVGTLGLLGPLAREPLSTGVGVAVGVMIATVFGLGSIALILVMAVAYGTVRVHRRPRSLLEWERVRLEAAINDRRRLLWGHRLAIAALGLLVVAIVVAWSGS